MQLPGSRNLQLFYPNWKRNVAGMYVWSFLRLVNIDYLKGTIRKSFKCQCSEKCSWTSHNHGFQFCAFSLIAFIFVKLSVFLWFFMKQNLRKISRNNVAARRQERAAVLSLLEKEYCGNACLVFFATCQYWLFKGDYKKVLSMPMLRKMLMNFS